MIKYVVIKFQAYISKLYMYYARFGIAKVTCGYVLCV